MRLFRKSKEEISKVSLQGYKELMDKYHLHQKQRNQVMAKEWMLSAKAHSSQARISKIMQPEVINLNNL